MLSNTIGAVTEGRVRLRLYENPCDIIGIDVVAGSEKWKPTGIYEQIVHSERSKLTTWRIYFL